MKRIKTTETVNKIEEKVLVKGWVHVRRNMGKIVFLDLRDRWGILQVVVVPSELDEASQELVKDIRPEFVLSVEGVVQARGEKQTNKDLATGTVELLANKIEILAEAETPPFEIENEDRQANEELRMKYRYLDLRHERMKNNMVVRDKVISYLRNWLHKEDFLEIQTPILSKSTPEGARDYLVPSRVHKGKFFALPQAPQQYKQLLMVAGMERYFQIAPCFRDEDARADRSPGEFYQLDMEMSFVSQEDILQLVEKMFTEMVKELFPEKKITQEPWPRLNYEEAIKKYNSDKPDLRKDKNDPNELAFAWVVNFPLFTPQTEEDKFHGAGDTMGPTHNMFTMVKEEDVELLDKEPLKARSYQHDLVLNGFELGGGAVRIHDMKIQEKIWDLIGFTDKQKQEFKHYFEAFKYGAPPHGGIAPGIERLIMILQNEKNLREITAFPLTSDARDPMMESPSEVSKEQLDELGIEMKK
ncbi:aspartate--tRNA ligase [Candidatus Parcubacteria bacterium]|nr:MAG: aspartate--tRNA ligase [Candidatus Parcubacteria bacterium]